MTEEILYECTFCGLHYEDEQTAKQCATYCKEHNGCSSEITKASVERRGIQKTTEQPGATPNQA